MALHLEDSASYATCLVLRIPLGVATGGLGTC
jgi:hypothetical protein